MKKKVVSTKGKSSGEKEVKVDTRGAKKQDQKVAKVVESLSDNDSSESGSSCGDQKFVEATSGPAVESLEYSAESSEEEKKIPKKKTKQNAEIQKGKKVKGKKKVSDSEDDKRKGKKKAVDPANNEKLVSKKKAKYEKDDSSDETENEEPQNKKSVKSMKSTSQELESNEKQKPSKMIKKMSVKQKEESSDEEEELEEQQESDEEPEEEDSDTMEDKTGKKTSSSRIQESSEDESDEQDDSTKDGNEEEDEESDDSEGSFVITDNQKKADSDKKRPCVKEDRPRKRLQLSSDDPHDRTVFCGGIPVSSTEESVTSLFSDAGTVEYVNLLKQGGACFVCFTDTSSIPKALKFDGTDYKGKTLRVNMAKDKPSGSSKSQGGGDQIFIRNLAYSTTEESLREAFEECGEIVDLYLPTDENGQSKGWAKMRFDSAQGAKAAIEWSNTELDSRTITVEYSRSKGSNNQRGRGGGGGRGGKRGRGR